MSSSPNRRQLTNTEHRAIVRTFEHAVDTPVDDILDAIVLPRASLGVKAANIVVIRGVADGIYDERIERAVGKNYLRRGYEDTIDFLYPHITTRGEDRFAERESTIKAIAALSQRSTDELNHLLRYGGVDSIHKHNDEGDLTPIAEVGESGRACPYGALPPRMPKPLFKEFCKHAGALLVESRQVPIVNVSAIPKVVYNLSHER